MGGAASLALPWDSEQLDLTAHRLICLCSLPSSSSTHVGTRTRLLSALQGRWREQGVHHVSARIAAPDGIDRQALSAAGFLPLSQLIELSQEAGAPREIPPGIRSAEPKDLDEIQGIAETSFQWDRFHEDPAIQNAGADRLHRAWARNCCTGRSDEVLVHHEEGRIHGFSALTLAPQGDHGRIELIAVHPRSRGRGVGRCLVEASLSWFANRTERILVSTQASNIPALRLYGGCGFLPERTLSDYRWWHGKE